MPSRSVPSGTIGFIFACWAISMLLRAAPRALVVGMQGVPLRSCRRMPATAARGYLRLATRSMRADAVTHAEGHTVLQLVGVGPFDCFQVEAIEANPFVDRPAYASAHVNEFLGGKPVMDRKENWKKWISCRHRHADATIRPLLRGEDPQAQAIRQEMADLDRRILAVVRYAHNFFHEGIVGTHLYVGPRDPFVQTRARVKSDPVFIEPATRRRVTEGLVVVGRHDHADIRCKRDQAIRNLVVHRELEVCDGSVPTAVVDLCIVAAAAGAAITAVDEWQ